MSNEEFSNEFDILINSNNTVKPIGLSSTVLEFDEYEKSVFLTRAQESVIASLYKGSLAGSSFEETEELRRYLSELVKTYSTSDEEQYYEKLTANSHFFSIPEEVWFITYEAVISQDAKLGCAKGSVIEVVPVTQDEFHKIKENPFRRANKRRVLRLDIEGNIVELISEFSIDKYQIRYLAKPDPIILIDLPEGLSINGLKKATDCKLNPALHRLILETAVTLALKSRTSAGK